jgi:hypothetical protein
MIDQELDRLCWSDRVILVLQVVSMTRAIPSLVHLEAKTLFPRSGEFNGPYQRPRLVQAFLIFAFRD